jgi:hypothetical protein
MSLAKHFFAKLRDSQQTLPCMISCINSGVLCKINHLLLEICRWNLDVGCYYCWWVLACSWLALLLLVQLLALVLLLLNACLPFSSWMDLELQVLLHGFVGWWSSVFVVLWKNCGVLCDGPVLVECELLALVVLIFTNCWLSWAVVVLPATLSQSYDWAACVLCACMPHCVDLIHLQDVLWNCLIPKCFVPQLLKEHILYLVNYSQWWKWHYICQNLRVTSNPNSVSIWSLFVL